MSDPHIEEARRAFAEALAAPPKVDGHAMTAATAAICTYRDELRGRVRRQPGDAEAKARLRSANLVVSLLLAGHYPLGETPWAALDALPALIDGLDRPASA